jgi:TRAP-type C4-dicarboxylate transport system substrate-binding protein
MYIPFLFSSREQVSAFLDGPIGDELDKPFQKSAFEPWGDQTAVD